MSSRIPGNSASFKASPVSQLIRGFARSKDGTVRFFIQAGVFFNDFRPFEVSELMYFSESIIETPNDAENLPKKINPKKKQ